MPETPETPETNGINPEEMNGADGSSESAGLQKRIEELETQLKDKEAKYLYLYAEFENFRKRSIKERSDSLKFGWEPVARDLLQTLDNLERAVTHMPIDADKNFAEGIKMVLGQFKSTLQKQGVEAIASIQKAFDPNLHEAVAQEPSEHPEGTILKEAQPGYMLHGRLLRPSRVVVSGGRAS